jgi:phosphocarrier protein HPr
MITRTVTIKNRAGLHTRPAATLVKTAARFQAEFTILKDEFEINGKSIIGVMTLAAEQGSALELRFNGPDELDAAAAVVELFERGFDEE